MSELTIEGVISAPALSGAAISPDGTWVAYVVGAASREGPRDSSAIWLVGADGQAPRQFTWGGGCDSAPTWSPDGAWLAFLSDRAEPGVAQLYVMPRDGGEARRLTSLKGGVAAPAWSPDGAWLAFLACPDEQVQRERDRAASRDDAWEAGRDEQRQALWLMPFHPGGAEDAVARRLSPPGRHVWGFALSPDGARVAAFHSDLPEADALFSRLTLAILSTESGLPGPSWDILGPWMESWPVWSADGARVLFLAGAYPTVNLYAADPAAGAEPLIAPTEEYGTPVSLRRALGGDAIYALCTRGTTTDLYEVDATTLTLTLLLTLAGVGRGHVAPGGVSVTPDGSRVAMLRSQPDWPVELWLWEPAVAGDTSLRRLTDHHGPWLAGVTVGRQEVVRWKGHDGLEIEGVLVHPPGAEDAGPLPLVVEIHGGPAGAWTDRWLGNWHDWAQPLAARGMRVLLPNPRGSTGRGNGYATANLGDIGGGDLRDVLAGVDALVQRGLADPARLGIGGWSYGGTLTGWAVTQDTRFRCAVVGAGITNWTSFSATTDIRTFGDLLFQAPLADEPERFGLRSATFAVRHLTTPTLIVHGEADVRVPLGQSRELYTALRQRGVAHAYVTYPREGHQILERAHQRDLLTRVLGWFTAHLGQGA